jgi:hypothetical protein
MTLYRDPNGHMLRFSVLGGPTTAWLWEPGQQMPTQIKLDEHGHVPLHAARYLMERIPSVTSKGLEDRIAEWLADPSKDAPPVRVYR